MWASSPAAVLSSLFRRLPAGLALFIGRLLGLIWYYLVPIRRGVVRQQLARAFGSSMTKRELRRAARGVFENLGLNVVEFLRLDPDRPEDIRNMVRAVGMGNFRRAEAKGRGVLVLTAHFGNWDLLCCSQALSGHPITILSKTIKPAWLNRYWMETRRRCGVTVLPDRGVLSELLKSLDNGAVIGFVIDQHMPPKRGIAVDFFGRPASTSPGLARLALLSGAPVVPIFLFRESGGRHRMEIMEAVDIEHGRDENETLALSTRRYNEVLEAVVRRRPDHWLWLHRRWKLSED